MGLTLRLGSVELDGGRRPAEDRLSQRCAKSFRAIHAYDSHQLREGRDHPREVQRRNSIVERGDHRRVSERRGLRLDKRGLRRDGAFIALHNTNTGGTTIMTIKHVLPPPERRAFGQSRRKQVRRQEQNRWSASDRQTDPIDALAVSAVGRVPALLAIKWQRMAISPFGFFRGAVSVMAADLAVLPHTGIFAQLCGDAHVRNLGAYAAPDGRLVFDINDFDETIRGPFEWDVKRLATSIILAGRESGSKGAACGAAAALFLRSYRRSMRAFAHMTVMEVAHFQVHRLQRIAPVSQVLRKAEQATPVFNAARLLTEPKGALGKRKVSTPHKVFIENKPLQYRLSEAKAEMILDSLTMYRETLLPERQHFFNLYRPLDVAFRVVGTGSVGLRDYIVYLEGNGPEDPLFLQIKEEPGSAYAPYLGEMGAPQHQGQRVVQGQRAMQFLSDMLLGWTTIHNRQYLVRQLNDHKASIEIEDLR